MSATEDEPDEATPTPGGLTRLAVMTALGPITLIGALQADFHTPGDQLLAGLIGTFCWFTVIAEVIAYV